MQHQSVIEVYLVQAFLALIGEHVAYCVAFVCSSLQALSPAIMGVRVSHRNQSPQTSLSVLHFSEPAIIRKRDHVLGGSGTLNCVTEFACLWPCWSFTAFWLLRLALPLEGA